MGVKDVSNHQQNPKSGHQDKNIQIDGGETMCSGRGDIISTSFKLRLFEAALVAFWFPDAWQAYSWLPSSMFKLLQLICSCSCWPMAGPIAKVSQYNIDFTKIKEIIQIVVGCHSNGCQTRYVVKMSLETATDHFNGDDFGKVVIHRNQNSL